MRIIARPAGDRQIDCALSNCVRKDIGDNLSAKRREGKTLLAKVVKRRTDMNQR